MLPSSQATLLRKCSSDECNITQSGGLLRLLASHGTPVSRLCQVCYFHLRRLRTVRRSLTKESLLTLVHAFVTSRIDHCNAVLYGSSVYLLDRLQSVLNSAVRLILNAPKFSRISSTILDELHWLPIERRIRYKIALLVRHCIAEMAPEYLVELCRPVSLSTGRQTVVCLLCSWWPSSSKIPTRKVRPQGLRSFWASNLELTSGRN